MKKILLLVALSSAVLFAGQAAIVYGLNGGSFLSLRDKPIDGAKIGKLYNNDKVTILNTKGKWYQIKLHQSNKTGWAHGDWIKMVPNKKKIVTKKKLIPKKTYKPTQNTQAEQFEEHP